MVALEDDNGLHRHEKRREELYDVIDPRLVLIVKLGVVVHAKD